MVLDHIRLVLLSEVLLCYPVFQGANDALARDLILLMRVVVIWHALKRRVALSSFQILLLQLPLAAVDHSVLADSVLFLQR